MTATHCLTSGKPESPRCAGDSFCTPSRPRPGLFNDDENQAVGSDVAGDNTGNRGQSPGLVTNPTPTPRHPSGRATRGPQGCPGGPPHFFTAVPPALWLGQEQPRPPRSPRSPGRVPAADEDEDFLQALSPSGLAA